MLNNTGSAQERAWNCWYSFCALVATAWHGPDGVLAATDCYLLQIFRGGGGESSGVQATPSAQEAKERLHHNYIMLMVGAPATDDQRCA